MKINIRQHVTKKGILKNNPEKMEHFYVLMGKNEIMGYGQIEKVSISKKLIEGAGLDVDNYIAGPDGVIWDKYDKNKYFVQEIFDKKPEMSFNGYR